MFNLFMCVLSKTRIFEQRDGAYKLDEGLKKADEDIVIFEP